MVDGYGIGADSTLQLLHATNPEEIECSMLWASVRIIWHENDNTGLLTTWVCSCTTIMKHIEMVRAHKICLAMSPCSSSCRRPVMLATMDCIHMRSLHTVYHEEWELTTQCYDVRLAATFEHCKRLNRGQLKRLLAHGTYAGFVADLGCVQRLLNVNRDWLSHHCDV